MYWPANWHVRLLNMLKCTIFLICKLSNITCEFVTIKYLLVYSDYTNYEICFPEDNSLVLYKWNESGFRPLLWTYRLNWPRRASWGWWDDWDDTAVRTQDSKVKPWRAESEHATSRSRRLPKILGYTSGRGRMFFVSFKPPRPWNEPQTLAWKAAVLTTTLGPPPLVL